MAWPMTSRRALLAVLVLVAAACGGEAAPPLSRELSLPAQTDTRELSLPPASTTTTTAILAPADADRLARAQLRSVLAVADELYAERGTFDLPLDDVAARIDGVPIVALESAASDAGVVYDPRDQRLALHNRSQSGRWFCISISGGSRDYGFGETFTDSLDSCTDGVLAGGWGNSYSPNGPEEAAVTAVVDTMARAVSGGDVETVVEVFESSVTCPAEDLAALWPDGVVLIPADEYALLGVVVDGDRAEAELVFGPLSNPEWGLRRSASGWRLTGNPCELFGPLAAERVAVEAADVLERGLFAVRSVWVATTTFTITIDQLGEVDADLHWVGTESPSYGTLFYSGREEESVLATPVGPDELLCAVESSNAPTRYGRIAGTGGLPTPEACAPAA
ncbi:MAG: hypothetical protein KJO17_01175 [Acidimicrobiia bacterium]|nr:hypothetical protein [Acidimicrobiia bacterium]